MSFLGQQRKPGEACLLGFVGRQAQGVAPLAVPQMAQLTQLAPMTQPGGHETPGIRRCSYLLPLPGFRLVPIFDPYQLRSRTCGKGWF